MHDHKTLTQTIIMPSQVKFQITIIALKIIIEHLITIFHTKNHKNDLNKLNSYFLAFQPI